MSLIAKVRGAGLTATRSLLLQQSRNVTLTPIGVAIPARTKVSKPQMALMCTFMFSAMWAIPVWILVHLEEYQTKKN